MEKDCSKCGVPKSLEEFGKHKNGLLGRSSECKKCQSLRDRKNNKLNKDKIKVYNKVYNKNNQKSILEYNKSYLKKRYAEDPIYKFKANTRSHINVRLKNFLKTKKGSTLEYLGCDWETYINHLEKQFDNNMSWDNHGVYWEVDHIIPLSKSGSFHYTNCQPLTVSENRSKSNKL